MKTSRRSAVDAFIVMDVVQAAQEAEAAGRHIIHMEVGQPGSGASASSQAALTDVLATQSLGYTVALGLPALREGIAQLYSDWYGITLDPQRVIVTAGSSGAFLLAFTALFDAGARVGLSEPGYPSYRQILKALDLVPVGVPTHDAAGHRMTPDDLPSDLDGLIVASPANPTGTILDKDAMAALITACADRDAAFISDEIYHGLHFDTPATSALEISDDVYVINSFSKYFSMTGWRIGWMVVPPEHVRTVERLAQNMFICASHAAQVAALGALSCRAEPEEKRSAYAESRALLLEGLPKAGFARIAPPDGAFYIYADVSHLTDDSRALAADMLEHAGVAVTPGLDFDPVRGHHTLRFSYAADPDDIREGLARITKFMQARTDT
ncbi:aminotransferase class I/II-fold pyridoxal phosphate-dependent enzyme [Rhodobacteraceae bacterium SC52]|nr:aminotransferase class I/II-fold pyridoxal phosphate-dependent enzyme [Rhodobacteraceae bacterium SC52]